MLTFTIRKKMVLLVLIVLIPLFILDIAVINSDFKTCVSIEQEASEDLANVLTSNFNNYLEELWAYEATIGSLLISNSTNSDDIQGHLLKMVLEDNSMSHFSWIGMDGIILASQNPELIGTSVSGTDYFSRTLAGEKKVVSELNYTHSRTEPFIIVTRAIENNGELQGILTSHINPNLMANKLVLSADFYNREFGFIDGKGNIISINLMKNDTVGQDTVVIINESIPGGSSNVHLQQPIGLVGWKCFVSTNYDLIKKVRNTQLSNKLTILMLSSAISILLALVVARKTLGPLINIKETISAVKNGNYTVRSNIYGNDELAATAQDIDIMVDTILANDLIKSQAFTDLSHELKAPLNVIFASSQLIESITPEYPCPSHTKVIKYSKSIRHNCYKLIKIISNLLDVSKYENGHLIPHMENRNIISIIEDATMSVVPYAENKGVSIVFDTDTEEKYTACDQNMIERIMLNLLSNALKFTDRGGSVSVNIISTVDRIIVRVDDTGIGIPPEKVRLIFDRFKQADSSLNRNHYGSGLGLALVKSLVEAHRGNIYATSEFGKGTSFIIHIPIRKLTQEESNNIEHATGTANGNQTLTGRASIELSDINDVL